MKHKFLNLTIIGLAMLMAVPANAAETPKREHRSAWISTVWGMCWPSTTGTSASVATQQKNEAIEYLDLMKENGFNAVYFQVRGMSDAMYNSAYEPWSSYVSGTRGSAPAYDPLEFWVTECHKRGMECHAWLNPYRYDSEISSSGTWTGSKDYLTTNPDWVMEYNNASILNPGITAVQDRIVDVCKDIISNYDVDGIIFDDYFYLSNTPLTQDQALYNASGSSLSQADWRRENVNTMVRKVYNMIQSVKPYVKFGIGPAGVSKMSASKYGLSTSSISSASDWQYDEIHSDPLAWLGEGTVDYISPQLYWVTSHSSNPYGALSKWWSEACAGTFKRHFYSSHSISFLNGANTTSNWEEMANQIQCNRDYSQDDAPGCALFASRDFTGKRNEGLAPYLKTNKFQNIALQPKMYWKSSTDPGAVTNLALSGSTLSWTGHTNVRYAVYAVPTGTTVSDDVSSQYLIGNPYEATFDVSGYTSGYRLGVSVVDRVGYEYAVTWLGSSQTTETLGQVTINTPTDGSTVSGDFNFGWTALTNSGVTYTLEVSTSSTFSSVNFSVNTTGTSYASSHFALAKGTTYYWRVKASKTGCTTTTSWVGSFTIKADTAENPTTDLVKDPGTYSKVGDYSIESQWIYSISTNNFPSVLGGDQRGMAALNGKVYIIQRDDIILEFSGETGEHLRSITLSGDHATESDGSSLSYKCNDIFVDGAGNLCVSNMTLNSSSSGTYSAPLTVCTVNVSTGATTRVFEAFNNTVAARIDYAAAYGDVTATGGQIWAACANSNYVLRYTRNANGTWTAAQTTIGTYYPSSMTASSTAPRIMPISTTQFILDAHNSAPTLYTFRASGTATYVDGFGSNTAIEPTTNNYNGICTATLSGTPIFIYAESYNPYTFQIVTNPNNFDFADMEKLWLVPEDGFGSEKNSYMSSQPAAINNSDGSVSLFLYTPNNGLACYKLTSSKVAVPQLGAVTLNNPIGGTTVSDGFSFSWSAISGATYTLEVSTSSTFSTVNFTATTTNNSYASSNFNLASATKYYWRVKASKDGYESSISSTADFTTSTPTLSGVTLTSPTDGATVEDGFDFSWSAISGATYTLEVSTLASFATVMYSTTTTATTYSSSNFDFLEGTTYHWRVKATKSGYQTSTSNSASFSTKTSTSVNPNPSEGQPVDPAKYEATNNLQIENLWMYALKNSFLPTQLGKDQRGMTAYNGNIYISERVDGAGGTGQLIEFSGETGEYLRTITLSGDYLTNSSGGELTYPCNDVFVDGAGHLCVSNMVAAFSSSQQLTICTVDVTTGVTTRVFQSNIGTLSMRVDYCGVYGDITKTGGKVYAASATDTMMRIYEWTRTSNNSSANYITSYWSSKYYTVNNFYPTDKSAFGKAPRVLAVSETELIVDGGNTYPTIYNLSSSRASIIDSFDSNADIKPTGMLSAGMCVGEIKGKPLFVYAFNDNETEFFNFAITYNPNDFDYASMEILWKVPQGGLGNTGHGYISSIPAIINNADGSINLYIYTPNNGIAGYRISDATDTGIDDIVNDANAHQYITVKGRVAHVSVMAETIEVYTPAGVLVAQVNDSKSIDLSSLVDGIYVINAVTANGTIAERIVLK